MKNLVKGGVMAALLIIGAGCGSATYPTGGLFASVTQPNSGINRAEISGAGKSGDKVGEACAMGIIGAIAIGDASIDAAKKAGQITEVHSVEFKGMDILGMLYRNSCTVVHGK